MKLLFEHINASENVTFLMSYKITNIVVFVATKQ